MNQNNKPQPDDQNLADEAREIIKGTEETLKDITGLSIEIEASKAAKKATDESIEEVEAGGDVDKAQDNLRNKLSKIDEARKDAADKLNEEHRSTQEDLWREEAQNNEGS